jgi:hypothetical protein
MTVTDRLDPAAQATPIPVGRGRWRLTLHRRLYAFSSSSSIIGDLGGARNRKLVTALNSPAVLTFDVDGWSESARQIRELATDVIAWRWDEASGADVPMFHGLIGAAQDTIDEQSHTVTVTATDYLGMWSRRQYNGASPLTIGPLDQDSIVVTLGGYAGQPYAATGAGTKFNAAAFLPIDYAYLNPDGTTRGPTGVTKTLTIQGGSVIFDMFDNLAHTANGFDYALAPVGDAKTYGDHLGLYYPRQGVTRTNPIFNYPGNVTGLTRSLASSDYANYWRTIGNNQTADATQPQLYGEASDPEAFNVNVGVFMTGDQDSDMYATAYLGQIAQGRLNIGSVLQPTYTLTLRPGWFYLGAFNIGDTIPLVVQSGRLNVNTALRVLGITYEPTDDGVEVVTVTVGRSPITVADMLTAQQRDIGALARR